MPLGEREGLGDYMVGWLALKHMKLWGTVIFVILVMPLVMEQYGTYTQKEMAWYIAGFLAFASTFWNSLRSAADAAYQLGMTAHTTGEITVSRSAAVTFLSATWYIYVLGAVRRVFGSIGNLIVAAFAVISVGLSTVPV